MADRIEVLVDRVTVIEREIEGEKRVTRHILEQTRLNGEDIAALKRHFDAKFDGLATKQDGLAAKQDGLAAKQDDIESKVRGLDRKFDSFVKDFPALVAATMREVLNEREK